MFVSFFSFSQFSFFIKFTKAKFRNVAWFKKLQKMNRLLCLIFLLFYSTVFSQEIEQSNSDSLKIGVVKRSRNLFWQNPIKHYGWVTDYEKLYTKEQIKTLNDLISKFEKETSNEIAIVSLDSLRVTDETFEDLSLRIAQKWGIGKAGKDNGIVIVISKQYRKIRIQNGNGIEKKISDQETKVILNHYFIPDFKNNNYYSGTINGVLALMKKLN